MSELKVDVEFWCAKCGKGICSLATARRDGRGFDIEPCETCLDAAKDTADGEGWERGYKEAHSEHEEPA